MRTMNMNQYEGIRYEHSADTLDEARAKSKGEEYEPPQSTFEVDKEKMDKQLAAGIISQAEYDTFMSSSSLGKIEFVDMDNPEEEVQEEQQFISPYTKDDTY